MSSGDKFTNIVQKRLMGYESFKVYFLDYLKSAIVDFFARVYNKDGTFGSTKVTISSSSNDTIDLTVSPAPAGTDGSGHLIIWDSGDTDYFEDVPFENQTGNDYDVGIHYAERPEGVQINPRTGKPEYQRWQETWGFADEPASVTNQGGGVIRFRLPTSMCPGDRTCAGRKCLVWKNTPADGALTETIAIEELTVAYSGSYNYVDTSSNSLGQTLISTAASFYTLLLLGPTIARTGDLDIEAAADFWYIGEVTGNGPSAQPTVSDVTGQRLIEHSLSDVIASMAQTDLNWDTIRAMQVSSWHRCETYTLTGSETPKDAAGGRAGSEFTDNRMWLVVGDTDGTDALLVYTLDGRTWVAKTNPKNIILNAVLYDVSNNLWIAAGNADGSDTYIITSSDPVNGSFSEQTAPKNSGVNALATDDNGTTLGVGENDGSDMYVVRTTNGTSWSEISGVGSTTDVGTGIAFGNSRFVIVGYDSTDKQKAWYSIDNGQTFSDGTLPTGSAGTNTPQGIAWNGNVFVTWTYNGHWWTSPDGNTWTYKGQESGAWPDRSMAGDSTNNTLVWIGVGNAKASIDDGETWKDIAHMLVGEINPPNSTYPCWVTHDGYAFFACREDDTGTSVLRAFFTDGTALK